MPDRPIILSKLTGIIKMKPQSKKILLSIIALLAAGIGPSLFVAAQAGYASLSDLAINFLIPAVLVTLTVYGAGFWVDTKDISKLIGAGAVGGFAGTIGLEIVREIGFHLGGMPGDMPKLLGVLLLNRFALGPDTLSNIAGWSYHFWNGISFGIIYSVLFGRGKKWAGIIFALAMAAGFMMSPAVVAMGVGHFGVNFGWGFPATVILAHVAFGALLGPIVYKMNKNNTGFFGRLGGIFKKSGTL